MRNTPIPYWYIFFLLLNGASMAYSPNGISKQFNKQMIMLKSDKGPNDLRYDIRITFDNGDTSEKTPAVSAKKEHRKFITVKGRHIDAITFTSYIIENKEETENLLYLDNSFIDRINDLIDSGAKYIIIDLARLDNRHEVTNPDQHHLIMYTER